MYSNEIIRNAQEISTGLTPSWDLSPAPIPYFPQLRRVIASTVAILAFTYIEAHHPAPQDLETKRVSLPVEIDTGILATAIGVHRRTLVIALHSLCAWFRDERRRLAAKRAGWEFFVRRHTVAKPRKMYCLVGSSNWSTPQHLSLYRDLPMVAANLDSCGLSQTFAYLRVNKQVDVIQRFAGRPQQVQTVSSLPDNLALLQERVSKLGGDRRAERYERLRKAVKDGLATSAALSLAKKRDRRSQGEVGKVVESVDPVLPGAILERLGSR